MTFEQQIFSTFIGALAGFIFSIFLFYLADKWKASRINKNLSANLQKEFDYNINFLESYKQEYEKLIRQVTANDKEIFTIFRFNKLQRLFLQEAFNKGLLYKHLTSDEINDLDLMLSYFTDSMNQLHLMYLDEYKSDKTTQQISLKRFEFNRELIDKYLKLVNQQKDKLKELM